MSRQASRQMRKISGAQINLKSISYNSLAHGVVIAGKQGNGLGSYDEPTKADLLQ
jgi:hypothetical protein